MAILLICICSGVATPGLKPRQLKGLAQAIEINPWQAAKYNLVIVCNMIIIKTVMIFDSPGNYEGLAMPLCILIKVHRKFLKLPQIQRWGLISHTCLYNVIFVISA